MNTIPTHRLTNEKEFINVIELTQRNDYDTSEHHKHSYFEFFLFTKGGGNHEIDFESYSINSSSIHLVFPNQVHKVYRELDTFGYVVYLSKEYLEGLDYSLYIKLFHLFYLNPIIENEESVYKNINDLVFKIKEELTNQNSSYKEIIKSYVNIICNTLLRNKNSNKNLYKEGAKSYMNFLVLLEHNFINHYPISFYSSELNISERKLNEICKEFSGSTVSILLADKLILEAKKALVNSTASIKEILYKLNFSDPGYFNKFFKNKTGKTPNQFREENTRKYN